MWRLLLCLLTCSIASAEPVSSDLRLGRGLWLQTVVDETRITSTTLPADYPTRGTARVSILDIAGRSLGEWNREWYPFAPSRSDYTFRLVLADWLDDSTLAVLSVVGQSVEVTLIQISNDTATELTRQVLFIRGTGGGAVWEICGAHLSNEGESPVPTLVIETRDQRGVRTAIPFRLSNDAQKKRWQFDRELIGGILYGGDSVDDKP